MNGKYYDEQEAKLRFSEYDKDKDGNISLDEFIKSYLADIAFCKQQIKNANTTIEDQIKQKSEFEDKLKEAKASEHVSDYGIMQGSIVIVQIYEARDLPNAINVYAEVLVGEQSQTTPIRSLTKSPVWNEKYSFDVTTGNEKVTINMRSPDFVGKGIVCTATYTLSELKLLNYALDDWLQLKTPSGQQAGRLKVSLLWIVSRINYYNEIVNRIDDEIRESQNQLNFYTEKQKTLEEPFGFLKAGKVQNDVNEFAIRKKKQEDDLAKEKQNAEEPQRPTPKTVTKTTATKISTIITVITPSEKSIEEVEKQAKAKVDELAPRIVSALICPV